MPGGSSTRRAGTRRTRHVFGRPIGQNQGIQFPISQAYAATEAAALMCRRAAELFESGEPCGGRGQHGEAARIGGVVAGGGHVHADPRRFRIRPRSTDVERKFPRNQALSHRPDLEQHGAELRRRARARAAALLLNLRGGACRSRLDSRFRTIRRRPEPACSVSDSTPVTRLRSRAGSRCVARGPALPGFLADIRSLQV